MLSAGQTTPLPVKRAAPVLIAPRGQRSACIIISVPSGAPLQHAGTCHQCRDLRFSHTCRRKFPLYISQDGGHKRVRDLALSLAPRITYLQHIEDAPPRRQTT
jgi:hypothetical protein